MDSPAPPRRVFEYDVFLSYETTDAAMVKTLNEEFKAAGLNTYFAISELRKHIGDERWAKTMRESLDRSCHLVVYMSAKTMRSGYVRKEITEFVADVRSMPPGSPERRVFVLRDASLDEQEFKKWCDSHEDLKERLYPRSVEEALQWLTENKLAKLQEALQEAHAELRKAQELARQAFNYYQHARFWRPFSDKGDLHIFTCGRDYDLGKPRGGRTVIDTWDYQTAVDITHYFARHYRNSGVEIELPVSKQTIDDHTTTYDSGEFTRPLEKKNCVIIGSPDVSDFAEVSLAKLLGARPYTPGADFPVVGFRIRKNIKAYSTFYERSDAESGEGIHLLLPGRRETVYECTDQRSFGLMVLADNPYSDSDTTDKILILAGHTGVSTRAMALLLTESAPWCLDAFYELDQAIATMDGPIAAVIEVNFVDNRQKGGDGRTIPQEPGKIVFRAAIELQTGNVSSPPTVGKPGADVSGPYPPTAA